MRGKCLDRIDQMPIGIGLEEVATRTGHEYVLNERIIVVHGKDQHLGAGGACPDLPCCLDAVEERQRIVEDGDIGLGLSVARTIIETYDGKIWAENHAEGGALFRFTLPLPKTQ